MKLVRSFLQNSETRVRIAILLPPDFHKFGGHNFKSRLLFIVLIVLEIGKAK